MFQLVDFLLPFLNVPLQQADAFARIGGQLHASMLDFHDDAVGLRAGQRFRGVLKPVERFDGTVRSRCETVQVAVRGHIHGIGEPGVVAFPFAGEVKQDRMRGLARSLPVFQRVIAGFDEPVETACEPFFDDFARQLPVSGSNVERNNATYSMELLRSSNRRTPVSYTVEAVPSPV
mgnify:CR=1 FL=1